MSNKVYIVEALYTNGETDCVGIYYSEEDANKCKEYAENEECLKDWGMLEVNIYSDNIQDKFDKEVTDEYL